MTERTFTGERDVVVAELDWDYGVHIYNDDTLEGVTISSDLRQSVALALLGGFTDDLVERLTHAALAGTKQGQWSGNDWTTYPEGYEDIVRAILAAIFGDICKDALEAQPQGVK